ncbi:MAG: ABC transporter permease [Caldilineaceae bacterium]
MRYDLKIAWRNIAGRPVATLVTIIVVGIAIALSVAVAHLNDGLQRGIIRASDPFGVLVVGAKGSAQQLVLSTLLLQGNPVGNIPARLYDELTADQRVRLAVPIAMGDNVGGARIIGTNTDFFQLRTDETAPPTFQLASGKFFATEFEAVLGSQAAAGLGLAIGDEFVPAHGVARGLASDVHTTHHTVVGILQPSHTPFDNTVFTSVESVHAVHEEGGEHGVQPGVGQAEQTAEKQITAILVKPTGFIEQNQLWQEFYTGTAAQAAFPGRELGSLFDLLNQGQQLLRIVGILAAVMAALTLFLAIYSVMGARAHLLAILRGLGAQRNRILRIVLWETVVTALLGALFGRLLGYGVAVLIAARISQQSAIPVSIRYLPQLELMLWLLPLLFGVMAGLIPALQAYRMNVVEKLFPA